MATPADWERKAASYLKAELKRRNVTHEVLAERMNANGWHETKNGIANKLSRGQFTANFFLAVLAEIGCQTIRLEDV